MRKSYNKDIMEWNEFPKYDIIWTDPPWEERMVKWFQGKMKKETGIEVKNTLTQIITKLATLTKTDKPIVIEYSVKGHEYIVDVMQSKGHVLKSKNIRLQSMGREFILLVFNVPVTIPNQKGFAIIEEFFTVNKFGIVFDPFAGIGATAKSVIKTGTFYIGSELNPERYKRLANVLNENY